jgi:citrate lyase subunit alpha/citrate CoA-transferase
MKHSSLPIRPIEDLKAEAEAICGIPEKPDIEEDIVAAVTWVDGSVIDVVRKVKS